MNHYLRVRLIAVLREGMAAARNTADGQTKEGYIIIPADAYEYLYYAAYNTLKTLEELAGV